ncbi:MAG: hypothetical protein AAFX39_01515 [Pseudomonadota bacterium]
MSLKSSVLVLGMSVALTSPSDAAWEVYQAGVAGTAALAGAAILTVECLAENSMVIGIYDLTWPFETGEPAAVIVDDAPVVVGQYGSGDRIVLADVDNAGGLNLSDGLVAALSDGQALRVQAQGAASMAAPMLTFSLEGAGRAIELVAEDCAAGAF